MCVYIYIYIYICIYIKTHTHTQTWQQCQWHIILRFLFEQKMFLENKAHAIGCDHNNQDEDTSQTTPVNKELKLNVTHREKILIAQNNICAF